MLRIAGTIQESFTDGKGIRYVIFTQGCNHNCPKCHNPETHDFNGGYVADIDKILAEIEEDPLIDGITLSGGDPFYQLEGCMEVLKKIKETERGSQLNIWCYTGFKYEHIICNEDMRRLLKYIDVLVDGEYLDNQRCLAEMFKGSLNQRIIDVKNSDREKRIVLLKV